MRIDGKEIAQELLDELSTQTTQLKEKNIIPSLVVILVGEDPASTTYVRQKELKAQQIGAKATIVKLPKDILEKELLSIVKKYNADNTVHGIIVQRPLPTTIDNNEVNKAVSPKKDIDAFHTDSSYEMPLAAAVMEILHRVFDMKIQEKKDFNFLKWLQSMNIVVMGKGQTGGGPTINLLKKMGITPVVVDSKTPDPAEIIKNADILVCAVGKKEVVKKEMIKPGAILIAVGMHREHDGKLHGDYEEEDIEDRAGAYTPIPGGVGPINVAMLLKNLIIASQE